MWGAYHFFPGVVRFEAHVGSLSLFRKRDRPPARKFSDFACEDPITFFSRFRSSSEIAVVGVACHFFQKSRIPENKKAIGPPHDVEENEKSDTVFDTITFLKK